MFTGAEHKMLARVARELPAGEGVRLWCVRLDIDDADDAFASLLSADERERAASYPGASRGRLFVRGRGALRMLLGELTQRAPAELRFSYGPHGKPSLGNGPGVDGSREFNVTHARDLALVAVAEGRGRRVGVDMAWTEGEMRLATVVAHFFSAPERAAYEAADAAQRRAVFSRIWVRKEAYLKGRGEGISERIYETDFSGALDDDGRVIGAPIESDQGHWDYRDLSGIAEGFVASLALERRGG